MTGRFAEALPVLDALPDAARRPIRTCCWRRSSRSTKLVRGGQVAVERRRAPSCAATSAAYKGPESPLASQKYLETILQVDSERPLFWHGCNYPWSTDGSTIFYGLDFGANVWGSHLGVSTRRAGDRARLRARWPRLGLHRRRAGSSSATAAPASSTTIAGCRRASIPHFFADLDAALEIARARRHRASTSCCSITAGCSRGVRDTIADPGDRRAARGAAAATAGRACCHRRPAATRCFARVHRAAGAALRPRAASAPISRRRSSPTSS